MVRPVVSSCIEDVRAATLPSFIASRLWRHVESGAEVAGVEMLRVLRREHPAKPDLLTAAQMVRERVVDGTYTEVRLLSP